MSAWLCLHMTACLRVCLSASLPVCQSASLPVCQSASLKGLFYFCLLSWDSTLIRTLPVNSRPGRKWLTIIMTLAYQNKEWNSTFFCIFIDYRGHHRKGVAIYNATWVNLQQKTLVSSNTNWFWTLQRGLNNKKIYYWLYFCRDNFFLMTFSELPP